MNLDDARATYEASSGKYVPAESLVETSGRFTVVMPVDVLQAINLGGMFGSNLSADEIRTKIASALGATIAHARQTKAAKNASLPFRFNNHGLHYVELVATPVEPGKLAISMESK